MLFDLQGKRRRAVQVTYLMLAVLMGGGLVLFGIGGDVSGGLFDAFSDRQGGGGNSLVEKRLETAEKRLKTNPRDRTALQDVVRSSYQLAGDDADPNTGVFGEKARPDLERAAAAWERYLATEPEKPDDSLALLIMQVHSELGLNQPAKAAEAAEVITESRASSAAFLQLARYAALAGQKRKSDLAGARAIELAPRAERSNVKEQVKQIKALATQPAGSAPTPSTPVPSTPAP